MTVLTREQVRAVDRIAIERYHIPGIVLMENAARGAADVASQLCDPHDGSVLILCGGGNNGGDGLAIARHLGNRGHDVTIGLCTEPEKYRGDALLNWQIVQAMKIECLPYTSAFQRTEKDLVLIIDAIFGTGLTDPPRPPFEDIVNRTRKSAEVPWCNVLAIDIPSGLDCDTGKPLGPYCITADHTVTFVAQKAGFLNPDSKQFTGDVTVADIGCPREAIDEAIKMHP
jgi:NAD(P)H-hydrate epimerase